MVWPYELMMGLISTDTDGRFWITWGRRWYNTLGLEEGRKTIWSGAPTGAKEDHRGKEPQAFPMESEPDCCIANRVNQYSTLAWRRHSGCAPNREATRIVIE